MNFDTIRISFNEMKSEFERILLKNNFQKGKAKRCAEIFSTNSLEGVHSHGANRFPRFIQHIQKGYIKVEAEPEMVHSTGALEQWTGNFGPGPLSAEFCTNRVMHIAGEFGIGCVALSNTNHWMRAGTYGWQAAKNGYAFIAWTNTTANTTAWGAKESRLGNNPLVFAIPYDQDAVVMDFAMTQFSYGKMEVAKLEGKQLPYPGGFNQKGELTTDPGEILQTGLALPIGYWKGAGLSLLLDIFATILSAGLPTHKISEQEDEYGISQVFIAIDINKLSNSSSIASTISEIINDMKKSSHEEIKVRYPGEQILKIREENLKNGIPINRETWDEILHL